MGWLDDALEVSVRDWPAGAVERLVFGTADPVEIASALGDACGREFGAALADGFLYRVSVGCVFGCHLADGRSVIVKAYQPRWTPTFLAGVRRVQHHLWTEGFPCPEPIGDIFSVGRARAIAEAVLPDPGVGVVIPKTREVSAAGLADQIDRCRSLDEPRLADHPLRRPHTGVFPLPHSPIFDFDATAEGASWIEDVAEQALAVRDAVSSSAVIAHTDWSLRNIRIHDDALVAVYDADSLALVPEHHAVGQAAATWRNDGEGPDATPSVEELHAYIEAYADVSEKRFTQDDHRGAVAAALWTLAYIARCEHAIDPLADRLPGTRHWLRTHADRLLAS